MRKNPHDTILGEEPKEQHLSTVCKSCLLYIYIYIYIMHNFRREGKHLMFLERD